ncbi:acid phosphatase family membrane protein YuiD [Paucibacter oligotrophus]|uniref:Acid phosphatase family membrane protein YuiD n=1 Tax=Roseateles oligotrophus TaxID=1769250 RepID=A0A840LD22_9BURK|nr:hypothetical protein [Roseateles oligotrophus]MBB4846066.1 acid phosphatase family membrane protein YuiD [Roseateles oligotrophus]
MSKHKKNAARPCVVFDTGVLLHALLLNDERAKQLRMSWQAGACRPLIGTGSAQALIQALSYPALALDESQQHELLADFLPYAEVVVAQAKGVRRPAQTQGQVLPAALQDLLAAAGDRVDCLVSDTVKPAKVGVCRVASSEEFLASL